MAIAVPIAGAGSDDIYKVIRQTDGTYTALDGSPSKLYPLGGDLYSDSGQYTSTRCCYVGIILGTGTTPPTYSDYKMENYHTGLTYSNSTASWSAPNVIITESATNNTDANIIVSELGLFGLEDGKASNKRILFTRNVIEPVTIKPGETKTFTVKINFDKFSDAYSVS